MTFNLPLGFYMPNLSHIIKNRFPYEPTIGQQKLFSMFDQLLSENGPDTLLIKGYAGTGKTTIVSTLVNVLPLFKFKYILLAPTGRAAKVLANYSGKKAYTIHRILYKQVFDKETYSMKFVRQKNYLTNTVFIIDEASMIYDQSDFGKKSLLEDLIDYILEKENNKILFIGDKAQLPPVGHEYSGALDMENLVRRYHLSVADIELTEVVRQEQESGILYNATILRQNVTDNLAQVTFHTRKFKDIFGMNSDRLEDGLRYAYEKAGLDGTIIICRSNKQALMYNQYIRRNMLYKEEKLEAGDRLMIVKNNYYWLGNDSSAGFLANGDFVEVLKISNQEELYGYEFADLELRLLDYPEHPSFSAKANLSTLYVNGPALSESENIAFYEKVTHEFKELSKKEFREMTVDNPYLNALQVKFNYAITCHKSQGGQWEIVFIDQGFLRDEQLDITWLRWLYTGITRATSELYLVNFNQQFFQ